MRKLLVIFMLMSCVLSVKAQDVYVTADVSTNHSFGENMRFGDIFSDTPGFNVGVGYNFCRLGGFRLSGGFHKMAGRVPSGQGDNTSKFSFNTGTLYLDAMVNLTNIFCGTKPYRTNAFYIVAGGGILSTSNFSDFVNTVQMQSDYNLYTTNRVVPVLHIGIAGSIKLARRLDLALESKFNLASDRFNGIQRTTSLVDPFVDFNVGLSYFFTRPREAKAKKVTAPVERPIDYTGSQSSNQLAYGNRLQTGISFMYNFSDFHVTQLQNMKTVADYLSDNPSISVIIHSYADVEYKAKDDVANNAKLAQERAQAVYDKLVNTYNIAENRISIEAHTTPLSNNPVQGELIRAVEFEIVK